MDCVLKPFANAAWSLELDRRVANNKQLIGKINHLIDRCIRTSSNLIIPDVSIAALILSRKLYINLNAAKEGHKTSMKEYSVSNGQSDYFFYEHKETVKELRNKLELCNSKDDVLHVFKAQQQVWVLNSENNNLIRNGHNSKRPDSEIAYSQAGIEIIKNTYTEFNKWHKANWKIKAKKTK